MAQAGPVMSLIQYAESGAEHFIPYAKKKLRELHDYMIASGVASFSKRIDVSDGTAIYLNSLLMGHGVFADRIRITGGGIWHFYYMSGSGIYLGEIGKNIVRIGTGSLVAARSLDKSFGVFTEDGRLKVVNPSRKVSRVRDGEFDAYGLDQVTVNATTWGVLVSVDGADGYIGSEAVSLFVPGAISGTYTVAPTFLPSRDNFYLLGYVGVLAAVSVDIDIWDLNAEAKVVDATVNAGAGGFVQEVKFNASYYDAFSSTLIGDGGAPGSVVFHTATGGEIGSVTLGDTPFFAPGGATLVTTKTGAYQFVSLINSNIDSVTSIGCARCLGTVGVAGDVSYVLSYFESAQIDGFLDTYGFSDLRFTIATQNNAYTFVEIPPSAGPPNKLYVFSDGGVSTLLGVYTIDQTTGSVPEAVVAATYDTPWLVAVMPTTSAGPRRIRFFDSAGVVFSTDEIVRAKTGNIAVSLAGVTKDTVYVKAEGSGGESWLIGSDGTVFDMTAALPTFTTGGNINGFHTAASTIYGVTGGTFDDPDDDPDAGVIPCVFHVTNEQGAPLAPVVKRYSTGTSSTSVSVPARSNILSMQEFDAWNT